MVPMKEIFRNKALAEVAFTIGAFMAT